MAEKKIGKIVTFAAGKKSTVTISHDQWQRAKKNLKRVRVIEMDCFLNILLEDLLALIFMRWNKEVRNQFNPNVGGSLAYLTQKAKLVYSLGCIDKTTLVDLKQISKIRNRFAHEINITFTDAKVCEYVSKLSVVAESESTTNYRIYKRTVDKCAKAIIAEMEREVLRQAVLKGAEKEKKC